MKKTRVLLVVVALSFVLVGCSNLSEALKGKFGGEDNLNTLDENNNQTMPVEKTGAEVKAVIKYNNIFFGSAKYDPDKKNCSTVYWVHISGVGENPVENNIKLLLAGPTEKWKSAGYYSSIPEGTILNKVVIEDEKIVLDFSGNISNLVAGSCEARQAKQQIVMTAKYAAEEQLSKKVEMVVVTVNGKEFKF
ncbi:MAG: GerMN domain-containing protein [Patescibacteria group bacterium]|jgi:uncharacterized protein YcfL